MTQINAGLDYYGVQLPVMELDKVVEGAIVLLKVLNEDGVVSYHEFSCGISGMEQIGMLSSAEDTVREQFRSGVRRIK